MNQYKWADGDSKLSKLFRCLLLCAIVFTLIKIMLDIVNTFIYARSLSMVDMLTLIENAAVLLITVGMLGCRQIRETRLNKNKLAVVMLVMSAIHLVQALSSASSLLLLGLIYRITYWCLLALPIIMLVAALALIFSKRSARVILTAVGIIVIILALIYVFDCYRFVQYINEAWFMEIVINVLYRIADLGLICFFAMIFLLFWARPDCLKKSARPRTIPKAELDLLKTKLEIGAITEEQYRQQLEQLKYPQ